LRTKLIGGFWWGEDVIRIRVRCEYVSIAKTEFHEYEREIKRAKFLRFRDKNMEMDENRFR